MKKITVVAVFIFLFVFVPSSSVDLDIQVADQAADSGFTMPFINRGQDVPPPFGEAGREARAAFVSGAAAAERGVSIDGQKAAVASDVNPSGIKCLSARAVFTAYGLTVGEDAAANSDVVLTGDQSQFLTVHFIDVGQGDATFVDFGNFEALIDGGCKEYGQAVVNYIKPYVDGNLDLVIATHMHGDHIGGLSAVLGAFSVSRLIDSGDTADTDIYREYQAAAASGEEGCIYTGDENMVIAVGGELSLRIIDIADGQSNANNNSVVTQIDYHNVSILLPGDIESAAEQMGLKYFRPADVLKAAHHGSNTSSTSDFLNVVQPRTVIISAGINNPNNHPHWRALQRFAKIGANVYGTFRSGTIVLTTNGWGYFLDTNTLLTEMDAGARAQPAG